MYTQMSVHIKNTGYLCRLLGLEWVQRECGVTDLTVGYAHMLGSSTSGSWRNTHTQRFVFVIWLSGVTSTQSLNNASQVIPPAFVPPPIDTNNCCRLCGATPRPFRDSCSVDKTPEPCLMCLDEKEALAWYSWSSWASVVISVGKKQL